MSLTRFPALHEALTGQPANPKAQLQAAIATAKIKHAKRIDHIKALQAVVHRELEGALS